MTTTWRDASGSRPADNGSRDRRLLGAVLLAAAVALAALSHHYSVNAIVWISGRGALLAAAAALACLWLWDRWCRDEAGIGAYIGACASLAVALGSYEAVAALPLLMLLMIRWRGGRPLAMAAGPFALAAVYLPARHDPVAGPANCGRRGGRAACHHRADRLAAVRLGSQPAAGAPRAAGERRDRRHAATGR
jgi:hypothetical protein